MLQKSDGGFNYNTTDLAAMRHRVGNLGVKEILFVTDDGQAEHFEQAFYASRAIGYLPADVKVVHVPFGVVLGPDKQKFRSRSGKTEKLIDLINSAVKKVREKFREKIESDSSYSTAKKIAFSEEEIEKITEAIGIVNIKYSDLSSDRTRSYVFDLEKMVSFDGNSAAYLVIFRKFLKNSVPYLSHFVLNQRKI